MQECLEVLGDNKLILSVEKQEEILSILNKRIKGFENAGNLKRREIFSIEEINSNWIGEKVYIVWDEWSLPVIQTEWSNIRGNEDDITAVAFETWIVSEDFGRMVEFNHNGIITEIVTDDI